MAFNDFWDDFGQTVRLGLKDLAQNSLGGGLEQAQADAEAFLTAARPKLARWADALASGALTLEEFEFLVQSQRDLAKLHALTAIGLAVTRLERFRTGLISLVVNAALKTIGL